MGSTENTSSLLSFERLNNTRDLGGMVTRDGRTIMLGKLIRSGQLYAASEKDLQALAGMTDTVVDFRSSDECEEKPDPRFPNVGYVNIPILDRMAAGVTRDEKSDTHALVNLIQSPESAKAYMLNIYRDFAAGAYSVAQYGRFARILLETRDKAILWHCTAGKDRAGFGTVIVLELLRVDRESIFRDYLKTNEYLKQDIAMLRGQMHRMMGRDDAVAEEALQYLFGAQEEYLLTAYRAVEELYGTFDGFIERGLHVSAQERERFRERCLK